MGIGKHWSVLLLVAVVSLWAPLAGAATLCNSADTDGDGQSECAGDCAPNNRWIYKAAPEVCDDIDNQCPGDTGFGAIDEGFDKAWWADADGDGFGSAAHPSNSCLNPNPGFARNSADCDDGNAAIRPNAAEVCDAVDNDCDLLVDDADTSVTGRPTWYADADDDTFGNPAAAQVLCNAPAGHVADGTDCDDGDAALNPAAAEVCDSLDNDCDLLVDDADPSRTGGTTWHRDADADTFGSPGVTQLACLVPAGYVADATDCDDADDDVNPAALEVCTNTKDDDCDGLADNTDRYVDDSPGSTDTANDCTDPLVPCRTIAHAVAQACAGGTVHVAAGDYPGNVAVGKPVTILGAQHGTPAIGRPLAAGTESVVTGSAEGGAFSVSSAGVVIDGFEIVGGGTAYAGVQFFHGGVGPFDGLAFRNNAIHALRARNPYSSNDHSYGILIGSGSPGTRGVISGIVIAGNRVFDIGVPGTVAGRGVYAYTVQGGSPGAGASITGNAFEALYAEDAANVGTAITIDVGNDPPPPALPTPCTGVLVSGNTYTSVAAAAGMFASASQFAETPAAFSAVSVFFVNSGRLTTLDEATLPPFARTDKLIGFPQTDAYFAKVNDAVAYTAAPDPLVPGDPRGRVFVSAGTFVEQVAITKPLELYGTGPASVIRAPATLAPLPITVGGSALTTGAIVRIDGAGSAIPVEVHHLQVAGPGPTGCGSIGYGLFAMGGAALSVHDATVADVRDEPFGGCQNGIAVRAGMQLADPAGTFASAQITNVTFTGYQKGAVVIDGAASSGTITGSSFTGQGPSITAQNAIQVSRGATATISGNTITGHQCSPTINTSCGPNGWQAAGILVYEAGAPVTVSNNAAIDGNDQGLSIQNRGGLVTATGNGLHDNLYSGIFAYRTALAATGNTITGGDAGVALYSGSGDTADTTATLTENVISGAKDGILVEDGLTTDAFTARLVATNNQIAGNTTAGLRNATPTPDDATCNWWGAKTGPNSLGADAYVGPLAPVSYLTSAGFGGDGDGDSVGSCWNPTVPTGDCDDTDVAVTPGALEVCDGRDNDCDALADDGVTTRYYADADLDGYGDPADFIDSCTPIAGRVTTAGDCNDGAPTIFLGAADLCGDGIDQDCDGADDTANVLRVVSKSGSDGVERDCSAAEPCLTINRALTVACAGDRVEVGAGTFQESLTITKGAIQLAGAGVDVTVVEGPGTAPHTMLLAANDLLVENLTITRDNLGVAWAANANMSCVSFGQTRSGIEFRNNKVTHCRNGVYLNNTGGAPGHRIHHNVLTDNRTGVNMTNPIRNTIFENNEITNNLTLGIVITPASVVPDGGDMTGTLIRNNRISGNWYGQVEDKRADLVARPVNLSGNWFGSAAVVRTTASALEPGYNDQVPSWGGGSAAPPADDRTGRISGPYSANVDYTPWLDSGADTDVVAFGFQGDFSFLHVDDDAAQVGGTGRVQEGVDLVAVGGTTKVHPGTYAESVAVTRAQTLLGDPGTTSGPDRRGPGADAPVIDGSSFGSPSGRVGLAVKSGDVTVSGLVIQGFGDGIDVGYESNPPGNLQNLRILDNRVQNAPASGVHGFGVYVGYEAERLGSTITAHLDYKGLELARNVVSHTTNAGFVVQSLTSSGADLAVTDNEVFAAGASSVWIDSSRKVAISGNLLRNSARALYVGCYASNYSCPSSYAPENVTFTSNVARDHSGQGLYIDRNLASVTRNDILNNPTSVYVGGSGSTGGINANSIVPAGGGTGVQNASASAVDANCNWWGTAAGPAPGVNTGSVTAAGWLLAADYNDDVDGDLYASCTVGGYGAVPGFGDCQNTIAAINPGALEVCDTLDNNCSGVVDEGLTTRYYADADADAFGDAASFVDTCTQPAGYVTDATDCNDALATVFPGAADVCGNGVDEDCSGGDFTTVGIRSVLTTGSDAADRDCTAGEPCRTITRAVAVACPGDEIQVGPGGLGDFLEDVNLYKNGLKLVGAGMDQTTITGKRGGDRNTIWMSASNLLVKNLAVTRDDGTTLEDWKDETDATGLNNYGLNVSAGGHSVVEDVLILHNRNGLYIENTTGNTIRRCVIDENRTGVHIVGSATNTILENNVITRSQTFGVLYRGGTVADGTRFTNNAIHGNWEAQVEVRGDVVGTVFDLSGNWFGSATLDVVGTDRGEPGYLAAPWPYWGGGPAVAPSPLPEGRITGGWSSRGDYTPWLNAGTDVDGTAAGFQGDFSYLNVDDVAAQAGSVGRIQEGVNLAAGTGALTVDVKAGAYPEQVLVEKALLLTGAAKASTVSFPATRADDPVTATQNLLTIGNGAAVEVSGFTFDGTIPGPANCDLDPVGVLARSGASLHLHHSDVLNVRNQPISGCQWGVGVSIGGGGTTATANVHDNTIASYQKVGLVIDGAGSTATVVGNAITGVGPTTAIAQNGIEVVGGAQATIRANAITANLCDVASCGPDPLADWQSGGVLVLDAGSTATIEDNAHIDGNDMGVYVGYGATATLARNGIAGRYFGLFLDEGTTTATDNTVTGAEAPVVAATFASNTGPTNGTLLANRLLGGADGLRLVGTGQPIAVTATFNDLTGTGVTRLDNATGNSPNVACNYWGSPAGYAGLTAGTFTADSWLLQNDFGADPDTDGFTSCWGPTVMGDCNQADGTVPVATEVCDGKDNNCNDPFSVAGVDEGGNALCDDGAWCTASDVCNGTSGCAHVDRVCDDLNGCTSDACNETHDRCDATPTCSMDGHVLYAAVGVGGDDTASAKPVRNVVIAMTGAQTGSSTTDATGAYGFTPVAGSLTFTPQDKPAACPPDEYTPADIDAVNSQDAVEIARYAVGLRTLTPFQLQLADVSNSSPPRVSSFDASLVAQKSVDCTHKPLPIATATASDWAYLPASRTLDINATPWTTPADFIAALWGDVDESWTEPETMTERLAPKAPVARRVPLEVTPTTEAELFLAAPPRRLPSGEWVAVLGLARADGIYGLDMTLRYDTGAIAVTSVRPSGIAGGMQLVSHDREGDLALALFGTDPLVGTGEFLTVTFRLEGALGGLPFELAVEANEGQIPVTYAPGLLPRVVAPRGPAMLDRP